MFSFLWLPKDDPEEQETKARALAEFFSSDISEKDLVEEIRHLDSIRKVLFKTSSSLDLLNKIYEKDLQLMFSSICIMLRIFNTIPVSVAEGERSFSKLKIVNNSLRSTMLQERLTHCLILSIERELARKISCETVIARFAAKKARRIAFD